MVKFKIKTGIGYKRDDILTAITETLPVGKDEIKEFNILHRNLNISDKNNIHYELTVEAKFSSEREEGLLKMKKKVSPCEQDCLSIPPSRLTERPVVVGAGPAGLFAALALAHSGARPILYERGLPVNERAKKIELFEALSILDPECNVQFGEGGAGTYSDGKLKVGAMDKYKRWILEKFISHGAPADILFSASAHIGTDLLSGIVEGLRREIESLGGEVIFGAKLLSFKVKDGAIAGGEIEKGGEIIPFSANIVIAATGHSAKDTFIALREAGAALTPRPFGIGVRIEHKREYVDRIVYGEHAPEGIETASYHLVTHLDNGRSVYSFCMCPGGTVVAASSERGGIVTNGMSKYRRDGENSNAAFLVSMTPRDFGSDDPFAGIALQRKIEESAYKLTGSYKAPGVRMEDFVKGRESKAFGDVVPTYPIGVEPFSPEKYLPECITGSLRAAISEFDNWMSGFYFPDSPLTGPETRSTSPVRVERDESFCAKGINGLYPVGEGAGYSGGIISSARDGLVAAVAILRKYSDSK